MKHAWVLELFGWILCDWHGGLHVAADLTNECSIVWCGKEALERCHWPLTWDADQDGDVDLRDFAHFQNAMKPVPVKPPVRSDGLR